MAHTSYSSPHEVWIYSTKLPSLLKTLARALICHDRYSTLHISSQSKKESACARASERENILKPIASNSFTGRILGSESEYGSEDIEYVPQWEADTLFKQKAKQETVSGLSVKSGIQLDFFT
jgi:hypothetical protein